MKKILSHLVNLLSKLKGNDEIKIIYVYRYISWALTSIVYLTGKPYSMIYFKLGVILSLFIASKLVTDLYIRYRHEIKIIRLLVLTETLGITLLLLPTGGLISPFIWYALNPTIVAANYLPTYFCWVNLTFYLSTGTIMSYILFNPDNLTMMGMLMDNLNLVLTFTLITLAVQMLAGLSTKMIQINEALKLSNIQKEQSMEQIMSLYQVIEALNNHCDKGKLFQALSEYTVKLIKSSLCIYWIFDNGDNGFHASNQLDIEEKEVIFSILNKLDISNSISKKILKIQLNGREFLLSPILSNTMNYGFIVIDKVEFEQIDELNQCKKLLSFLSELSAVTLERFNLDDMEDRLLVMEEQNRIANEIHDTVSQRLFSISYAIHGLLGRYDKLSKDELKEYLEEVMESSNLSMQELRNSIYRLSSKKKGEQSLQISLREFLDNLSKLHHIMVDFDIKGDEEKVSLPLKKTITRIIREGCGNAVRHGKCKQINLSLEIFSDHIKLDIVDDGKGFIVKTGTSDNHRGLGIANMRNLVHSFNGSIEIESVVNKGTEIHIIIPIEYVIQHEEGGIAI